MILAVDPGHAGERHEARICALLWSGDAEPRLLASENCRGVHEFKVWLVRERARWLGGVITVQWSARLVANTPLVAAILEVLIDQRPPEPDEPSAETPVLRRSY
ncbi:MAG TPA: hypothetical protein VMT87_15735 [Vicinamibacteria bacterium]|nr:hypothetical protein [Vicinamibacteria bacterium]